MARSGSYESPYVPSVRFENRVETTVVTPFIERKLRAFFQAQEGIDDLSTVQEVRPQNAITDIEWTSRGEEQIPFSYVYKVVMADARKRDETIHHLAYTLTYDPALTPNCCEETGTYYSCMTLAGAPILYYIRLDLPEILAEVREHARNGI